MNIREMKARHVYSWRSSMFKELVLYRKTEDIFGPSLQTDELLMPIDDEVKLDQGFIHRYVIGVNREFMGWIGVNDDGRVDRQIEFLEIEPDE